MKFLLDYPWRLPDCWTNVQALTAFEDADRIRARGTHPVPFFENDEVAEWMGALQGPRTTAFATVMRLVGNYCRDTPGICRATPVHALPRLRESWERALGDEMALSSWRSPQIVILESHQDDWPQGNEIGVRCHSCGVQPESGPHPRVLVVLERYGDHPFAQSDLDPWDRRHLGQPGQNHPCYLPRPSILQGVPFQMLDERLDVARQRGWVEPGRNCFIPPGNWRVSAIERGPWRQSAFPEGQTADGHAGPVDYRGLIWEWDHGHGGHWDVQLDPDGHLEHTAVRHIRVSHTGRRI